MPPPEDVSTTTVPTYLLSADAENFVDVGDCADNKSEEKDGTITPIVKANVGFAKDRSPLPRIEEGMKKLLRREKVQRMRKEKFDINCNDDDAGWTSNEKPMQRKFVAMDYEKCGSIIFPPHAEIKPAIDAGL